MKNLQELVLAGALALGMGCSSAPKKAENRYIAPSAEVHGFVRHSSNYASPELVKEYAELTKAFDEAEKELKGIDYTISKVPYKEAEKILTEDSSYQKSLDKIIWGGK